MKFSAVLKYFLLVTILLVAMDGFAQIAAETDLDTAKMRSIREKKIMYVYNIAVKFDSVKGTVPKSAKPDTTWTKFDRLGRETDFSYINEKGERQHVYSFYDAQGRLVRKMSCDSDSSDGFVDYWEYNSMGKPQSKTSHTLHAREELAYSFEEYKYNNQGQLIESLNYTVNLEGGEKTLIGRSLYSYPNGYTIKAGLSSKEDTLTLDSSLIVEKPYHYWVRRYSYSRSWNGKVRKTLVSDFEYRRESLGRRSKSVLVSRYYDYTSGQLRTEYTDTTYSDKDNKLLESRRDTQYEKFFWKDDGTLDYRIVYNRQNQPLIRRIEAFRYYE